LCPLGYLVLPSQVSDKEKRNWSCNQTCLDNWEHYIPIHK